MWREASSRRFAADTFDILVVGGGATGAGIALDAASRGLSVALLERADFSEGTSSRSTKLLHGGVRYLEKAVLKLDRSQFRLVRDGLHERHTLLRLAPHLARAIPLVTPVYTWLGLPYYGIGLKAYDLFSGSRYRIGASRVLGRAETLKRLPHLNGKGLKGSIMYFDGQFDDSRMNLAILRSAQDLGATLLNHAEVTGLTSGGDGRLTGASYRDLISGQSGTVRARSVINATGPFADGLRRMDDPQAEDILTVSSGSHLVVAGDLLSGDNGMLIPSTDDGRVLFLLPWQGHTLVGTTDNPAQVQASPRAPQEDIDYLLDYLGRYLDRSFSHADVLSAWTGYRPLVKPQKSVSTASITRDHYIEVTRSGLVTITGGKWTTYRHMAQDAVDRAIEAGRLTPANPSRTEQLPLKGASGWSTDLAGRLAREFDIGSDSAEHLAHAYGGEAIRLLEDGKARSLLERLHPGHPYLCAEVPYARDFDFAMTADDVLERRLRLGFLDRAAAEQVRPLVQELLASVPEGV